MPDKFYDVERIDTIKPSKWQFRFLIVPTSHLALNKIVSGNEQPNRSKQIGQC